MEEELYLAQNLREYIQKMNSLGIPGKIIVEIIMHEGQHFAKARQLGYHPQYGLRFVKRGSKIKCIPTVVFDIGDVKKEAKNIEEILGAPEDLSPDDIFQIEQIRREVSSK